MRAIFMGTPDFAVPTLVALVDGGIEIVAVYTQPPRPAGRGQAERLSPVDDWACRREVPVRTPKSMKDPEARAAFVDLCRTADVDVAVVVAYGQILTQDVLDAPRLGCVNVHASLLPRWRGAAPIQRAIEAGDAETGVALMRMEAGLDTGPVLADRRVPIGPATTAGDLHDTLAHAGAALIVPTLTAFAAGEIAPMPQPAEGVTYAKKIDKAEGRIDWTRPAVEIERRIRALTPWPGAWCAVPAIGDAGGKPQRLKVVGGTPIEGSGAPGTVLDGALTVACGTGALRLDTVQPAGKAAMAADAYLRGRAVPAGTVLQ